MGIKCSINNTLEYIVVDLATNNWVNYYDTTTNLFKDWEYGAGATTKPDQSVDEDGIRRLKALKSKNELNDSIEIKNIGASIKETKKSIKHYQDDLQRLAIKLAGSGIKTIQGSTTNFMDYTTSRIYFYRHQAITAKNECKQFYN